MSSSSESSYAVSDSDMMDSSKLLTRLSLTFTDITPSCTADDSFKSSAEIQELFASTPNCELKTKQVVMDKPSTQVAASTSSASNDQD